MNIINKIVHIINRQSPSIGDPKNVFTNVAVWFIACLAFAATSILSTTAVYADYTISMTTSGAHSVDVKPGAGGETGTSISEDAITVTTTCPNGYNLTLSTSVNDNNLYLGGDSSNNTAGTYFTPADGTTALSNAANTWGYYYESSNSNNTAPTKTSIFNPVPVKGSATTIKTSTSTSDSFSVYYGVAVSSSMTPGTYKMIPDTNNAGHDGAIVYQLTMSQSCLPYTVVFNPTSTAGGTNLSGTGTMNDQIIPAGVATALNSNTFTAPTGYEFDSWNTAQDGTGTSYTDGQSVTDLTTGGTSITLYAQWKKASTSLYNTVASMSKGTQTLAQLRAAITVPTSADRTQDTSNSGVYEYDTSVFGASSDASNDHAIYYYRGVLENSTASYGSNGSAITYPNYVILDANGTKDTSDTCWRIVRTTGSGGVKMIYNGKWTGSTCANTNADAADQVFNAESNIGYTSIIATGYTFNANYKTTTGSTAYSTLFGSNSNYSGNSTPSSMKTYIEDTWFTNIDSYSSILEPSAGYCNDRTIYTATSGTAAQTAVADSYRIATPYTTAQSGITQYYFGATIRTTTTAQAPTLGCPRSNADLYTTSSASNGNKQLSKPVALITADEAAFAGSGDSSGTTPYHDNSFLNSFSAFSLPSPYYRGSNGQAYGSPLLYGYIGHCTVSIPNGVRPAISLTSGTLATSGTGTAADPWVVEAPKTMQSVTSSNLATLMPNTGDTTTLPDARDGQEYTIAKLADGKYWMTTNLNIAGGTALSSDDTDFESTYTLPTTNGWTTNNGKLVLPASSTSGFSTDNYAYVYNTGNETSTCTSPGCYSYYSWDAATLGSGRSISTDNTDAPYSICPKGWRLPTSRTTSATNWQTESDFYALAHQYGLDSTTSTSESDNGFYTQAGPGTTPNFLLGGRYGGGSFSAGGSDGFYWSATSGSSSTGARRLYFNSSRVDSVNGSSRRYGFSVRCVKDPTMQSVTSSDLATLMPNTGDTTTLKDARDGQEYTIANLADGKYWMTTDLNLAGGTTLNASDSDVPSDNYYTLPASSTSGFSSETAAYVYNSGNTTNCGASGQSTECYSYYSWLAATAGGKDSSGSSVTSNGYNAAYSICPKGWRLPTATTSNASATSNNNWKTGDFYALATAYGANLESSYSQNSGTFYNNAGPGTTPNFLLAGYFISSSFNAGGIGGNYWSSTSNSSNNAYNLNFRTNRVISASNSSRKNGFTVRCLFGN